eukprot:28148-Pyramimonas_sp.AAC.1
MGFKLVCMGPMGAANGDPRLVREARVRHAHPHGRGKPAHRGGGHAGECYAYVTLRRGRAPGQCYACVTRMRTSLGRGPPS